MSDVVRHPGGFLEQQLNFKQHIKEKVQKVMTNLIKICAIQKCLTVQMCTTLVVMLCINLDYANAILYGLPKSTPGKYQKVQKVMTNLIKICAIQKCLTVQMCTTLVVMLCINLDYANAILYGLPKSTPGKYQTIQNMCAKLVLSRKKYSNSSLALKKSHWLPIEQRIEYKILTSTFKCITGTAPKYLQDLINTKENRRDNMHSNSNGITLQRPKVKYKTFAT